MKHGKTYANIRDPEEVFTIGMNRAVELLAQKAQRGGRGAAAKPLRELGEHPDGGAVAVYAGRYGPYVKWEKVNATLPKELAPEAVTLEQALELIAAKQPAGKKRAGRRSPRPASRRRRRRGRRRAAARRRSRSRLNSARDRYLSGIDGRTGEEAMRFTRRDAIALGAGALAGARARLRRGAGQALAGDSYEVEGGAIVIHPVEHASFVMTVRGS